jgi:hypothetical protein
LTARDGRSGGEGTLARDHHHLNEVFGRREPLNDTACNERRHTLAG